MTVFDPHSLFLLGSFDRRIIENVKFPGVGPPYSPAGKTLISALHSSVGVWFHGVGLVSVNKLIISIL